MPERRPGTSAEIAVVVPVRNGAHHVDGLLESLLAQEPSFRWELVVVDNGSTDGTAEVVESLLSRAHPVNLVNVQVVRYDARIGYASPRNEGVRAASAPLLGFCDSDDFVAAGWIDAITNALSTSDLVASAAHSRGQTGLPDRLPVLFGVPVVHAGGMACSRELFDRLGGFDPHFDRGGEDVDFSLRARAYGGLEPTLAKEAEYVYTLQESPLRNLRQGYRDGRSRVRLFRRHRESLHLEPARFRLLIARFTDHLRWSPRLFRQEDRCAYLRSCGLLLGSLVWSIRCRVRWF